MPKATLLPRPAKRPEYVLKYATKQSEKSWRDLVATIRNPMSDTWDFLTRMPQTTTPTNYQLEGSLGVITRDGRTFQRWQHKPTLKGSARVWFYVDGSTVYPGAGSHRTSQRDEVAGRALIESTAKCVLTTRR